MKAEQVAASKGEQCPHCGGSVFRSAQGSKCIGTCGAFLGGQQKFTDNTPHRTVNAGGLPARASHAHSSGRIA